MEPTNPSQFIVHSTDNINPILQRVLDGYINATALCKASGKQVNDYLRLGSTNAFLDVMETETGIPVSELIEVRKGGMPSEQGTWVHPHVAINLAQWASPLFAVKVSQWVHEWMVDGLINKAKPTDSLYGLIMQTAQAGMELERRQMVLDRRQTSLEHRQDTQEEKMDNLHAKVESVVGGPDTYTIKAYAKIQHVQLPKAMAMAIGQETSRICREKGILVDQVRDTVHGFVNAYPEDLLSMIFYQRDLLKVN